LKFGRGSLVTHSTKHTIDLNAFQNSNVGTLISRFWAQKKIDSLQISQDLDGIKEEIFETGQKFSIVTNDTSLIVLDKLEQFVRYRIRPPIELT